MITIDKDKDRITDFQYLKKLLTEEKNHVAVSDRLTEYFTKKYGPEFGGYVKVKFEFLKSMWIIDCGNNRIFQIEKDEWEEIPNRIKFLREEISRKSI